MLRTSVRLALLASLLPSVTACRDLGGPDNEVPPLAALEGDWEAIAMVVVPDDDPNVQIDLIASGVGLSLNIQRSGQYTQSIAFEGQTFIESGHLEIIRSDLLFHVESPEQRLDRFGFTIIPARLTLTGPFSFDLDGDGEPDEDGVVTITLELPNPA